MSYVLEDIKERREGNTGRMKITWFSGDTAPNGRIKDGLWVYFMVEGVDTLYTWQGHNDSFIKIQRVPSYMESGIGLTQISSNDVRIQPLQRDVIKFLTAHTELIFDPLWNGNTEEVK